MTTLNDYDSHAARRAQDFASHKNLTHACIEKPAMFALLPELVGKKVLCIGCGTGEECVELGKRGAVVWGLDSSRTSIAYARKKRSGCEIFGNYALDCLSICYFWLKSRKLARSIKPRSIFCYTAFCYE